MFDNRAIAFPSSINLPQRWQESCGTCGRKIDSNQETRDRGGKRSTLIRERQVGLRTATSSRPLLLLNISAAGRDRGVVAWRGHQGNGPPPRLYYLLRYSRRAGRGCPPPLVALARSSPAVSFPAAVPRSQCIIAHYSYGEIWIIHSIERSRRPPPSRFQSGSATRC